MGPLVRICYGWGNERKNAIEILEKSPLLVIFRYSVHMGVLKIIG